MLGVDGLDALAASTGVKLGLHVAGVDGVEPGVKVVSHSDSSTEPCDCMSCWLSVTEVADDDVT